jgi:hypothetical protein
MAIRECDGLFVVECDNLRMTIDPRLGGRIQSFSRGGLEALLPASAVAGTPNANNFGATFWPSPQSAWGWPPPAELDREPYRARVEGSRLVLESGAGKLLDGSAITLTKRFEALEDGSAISVELEMTNIGAHELELAPWQITRVPSGGVTIFALGSGGIARDDLGIVVEGCCASYPYDAARVTREGQKSFVDARGWVAHRSAGLLLVHRFPDLTPEEPAPGEAELELYADPTHTYVEIEPQGALRRLSPGTTSEPFRVLWELVEVPSDLSSASQQQPFLEWVKERCSR